MSREDVDACAELSFARAIAARERGFQAGENGACSKHAGVCHALAGTTAWLIGIVSIGDLVKWKISEVEAEADGLKAYIAAS